MAKEIKMSPPRVDVKNTTIIPSDDDNLVFNEGFLLRKASRFLTGGTEDSIVPIPVLYDVKTGKPLLETIPSELREEYEEYYKSKEKYG